MNAVLRLAGTVAFWILWPALYLYLNNSHRSRLVVLSGDSTLMVKGWLGDGSWSLPGGGVHSGEAAIDSVVREFKEETNLTVKTSQVKPLDKFSLKHRGISIKVEAFYAKFPNQLEAKAQFGEIAEVRWFKIDELLDKHRLSPDAKRLLSQRQWR